MKAIFFCPIYNEIHAFPGLVERFKANKGGGTDFLLVDNGCTDGCSEIIRESGLHYIVFEKNMSVGHAYIRALEWAMERDYEIFGTIAANGKMLPEEIPRLLGPIKAGKADYVSGSRFLEGGNHPNLPRFRRVTIPLVNLYVKLVLGIGLTDATCGYRAFRMDIIRTAEFDWKAKWLWTYGLEYYIYAKVLCSGIFRCQEVPVTMNYPPKGKPFTKIRPIIDWIPMLAPWLVARLDRNFFAKSGRS